MSIATELTRIATAKTAIKEAINAKGGSLTNETLDAYPAAIGALPSGGSDFYKCASVQQGDVTTWSGYKAVWDENIIEVSGAGNSELNGTYTMPAPATGGARVFELTGNSMNTISYDPGGFWALEIGGANIYVAFELTNPDATIEEICSAGWTLSAGMSPVPTFTKRAGWTFASELTTDLPVAAFWPTAGQIYTEDASMRVGNATVATDMDVM